MHDLGAPGTGSFARRDALLDIERKHSAHNYTPLPVVFSRGEGARVWDADGKIYWDFGGSYCAMNQGHAHPKITAALCEQAPKLSLASRAFTHDLFGPWCQYMTDTFGYERVLPLNSGAEVVEASVKLARAHGYTHKKIPPDQAVILTFAGNYHGRTVLCTSMSTTSNARKNYGPFVPGVSPNWAQDSDDQEDGEPSLLRYNDVAQLERAFSSIGDRIAGVLIESIQGEAGVILPQPGFLQHVKRLCQAHQALYIADEVQVGLGRAGHLVYAESQGVRPDVLLLAKSLSGGVYPTSCLLADAEIMESIHPNSHGATFSGSPLSCAVSRAALEVLFEERLCERAAELGAVLLAGLHALQADFSAIKSVRGAGLLVAIDLDPVHLGRNFSSWHLSMFLLTQGIVAKLVQTNCLKLTPPLVISEHGIQDCLNALRKAFEEMPKMSEIPGSDAMHHLSGSSTLA